MLRLLIVLIGLVSNPILGQVSDRYRFTQQLVVVLLNVIIKIKKESHISEKLLQTKNSTAREETGARYGLMANKYSLSTIPGVTYFLIRFHSNTGIPP